MDNKGSDGGIDACALAALFFVLLAGCATYEPDPLPEAAAVARRGMPDMEKLRVRASEFEHPLLGPLSLDLSDGLSPKEAAVVAVLENPALAAARAARGETEAQLVAAGLLPNPVLSGDMRHPYGTGSSGKVNAAGLGLGIDLSKLVGRAARKAEAEAAFGAVDLEIAWKEWQTAQGARLAVVRLAWLKKRRGLVEEEIAFEKETVSLLEEAFSRGDVAAGVLGARRTALQEFRRLEKGLALEAARARSRLDRLLGLPPEANIPIEPLDPGLPPAQPLPSGARLVERAIALRLDLKGLALGYEAQEARVHREVLAQFPSFSIGVSGERNEDALKFLGGFVNFDLPLFDRNQGGIGLARATRTRLRREYEARIARVRADVARLVREDALLKEQAAAVEEGLAAAKRVESAERAAMDAGVGDRLSWDEARSALSDLESKRAALLQARMEGRVALSAVVGLLDCARPGGKETLGEAP